MKNKLIEAGEGKPVFPGDQIRIQSDDQIITILNIHYFNSYFIFSSFFVIN